MPCTSAARTGELRPYPALAEVGSPVSGSKSIPALSRTSSCREAQARRSVPQARWRRSAWSRSTIRGAVGLQSHVVQMKVSSSHLAHRDPRVTVCAQTSDHAMAMRSCAHRTGQTSGPGASGLLRLLLPARPRSAGTCLLLSAFSTTTRWLPGMFTLTWSTVISIMVALSFCSM